MTIKTLKQKAEEWPNALSKNSYIKEKDKVLMVFGVVDFLFFLEQEEKKNKDEKKNH